MCNVHDVCHSTDSCKTFYNHYPIWKYENTDFYFHMRWKSLIWMMIMILVGVINRSTTTTATTTRHDNSDRLCESRGGRERVKKFPRTEFSRPSVPTVPTRVSQSQWTAPCFGLHSESDATVCLDDIQCDLGRCSAPLIVTATATFPQPLRWDITFLASTL